MGRHAHIDLHVHPFGNSIHDVRDAMFRRGMDVIGVEPPECA